MAVLIALAVASAGCGRPGLEILTPPPGGVIGNGIAPGQTPPTMFALAADYTTRGPWQLTYTAPGLQKAWEVLVLSPACESGVGCDLNVAVQTMDGDPITTSTFVFSGGRYEMSASWDADADCQSAGVTVPAGATAHVALSLVLGSYQAYGSAVRNPRITGTRMVTTTPKKDSGCAAASASAVTYAASGDATSFADDGGFPMLPGGLPSAGTSATWTVADVEAAKAYAASVFVGYAALATSVVEIADAARTGSTGDVAAFRAAAVRALKRHLAFMADDPASRCFADAYAADRKLADGWVTLLRSGSTPRGDTSAGRTAAAAYAVQIRKLNAFGEAFSGYFADCG